MIKIEPLKKFNKTLYTAPDKSITHRAVMFSAAARGRAEIKNALLGGDCLSTVDCMRRLGAEITVSGSTVTVTGCGGEFNGGVKLYAGNSGTTMRLLCGLLSGCMTQAEISGDESLSRRPMGRVTAPLSLMGASVKSRDGFAPLVIEPRPLRGIVYGMPVPSAQLKSAVLLAGLNADGVTTVKERIKSRDHTENMLKALGADITADGNAVSVKRSRLIARDFEVPGDISSAAYPLVLALCVRGGRVKVKNVGVNPTRTGILDVFGAIGAEYTLTDEKRSAEPSADIEVNYSDNLRPFNVGGDLIPRLIDELPILAVLACFIKGTSVVSGAEELRVKESDRIKTVAAMLRALGGDVEETGDGMLIHGGGGLTGGACIDGDSDHRIAMSAAVAGAASARGVGIVGHECADVSYPDFYKLVKE